MQLFTYNGMPSTEFGVVISGENTWNKPQPKLDRTKVPGRNGDILTFHGAFENVNIVYRCGIEKDFPTRYTAFMNYLLSLQGYHRLEDTYHAGYYRMAAIETVGDPTLRARNRSGEFDVKFTCKPQAFLKAGEVPQTFTGEGNLYNNTRFAAKPLLRVYGTGSFQIGTVTVTVISNDDYIDIDCEREDVYRGSENRNAAILLPSGDFPSLAPGDNSILLGDGITRIDITPRWWTL